MSSRDQGCPSAGGGHGIVQQHIPELRHCSLLAVRCWGQLVQVLDAGRTGPGHSYTTWGDKELRDPSQALSPLIPQQSGGQTAAGSWVLPWGWQAQAALPWGEDAAMQRGFTCQRPQL